MEGGLYCQPLPRHLLSPHFQLANPVMKDLGIEYQGLTQTMKTDIQMY